MQTAIEQAQLDFDAPMPSAAHENAPGEAAGTFNVGQQVFLKGAQYCGQPGRVLKVSHGKAKVWWVDLDYIGHHACNSLMLADAPSKRDL